MHPDKHFELVSASHTLVSAPPVTRTAERIFQIFGEFPDPRAIGLFRLRVQDGSGARMNRALFLVAGS